GAAARDPLRKIPGTVRAIGEQRHADRVEAQRLPRTARRRDRPAIRPDVAVCPGELHGLVDAQRDRRAVGNVTGPRRSDEPGAGERRAVHGDADRRTVCADAVRAEAVQRNAVGTQAVQRNAVRAETEWQYAILTWTIGTETEWRYTISIWSIR